MLARLAEGLLCVFVSTLWVGGAPLHAQVAAGEITGIVKDPSGAAVAGATVTVTDVATNRARVTVSTADGVYAAPSLASGEYRIDVELSGFKPIRRTGFRLSTGEKGANRFSR
jgi:hypothetical protein